MPAFGQEQFGLPGLLAFTSMSDSISMGTISSGQSSSSNLEFSSDTLIVTGGTPKPTPVSPSVPVSGVSDGLFMTPQQWVRTNQQGLYFDPITTTSWIYDPVFMTYISKEPGWFLIVQINERGIVEKFLYYDIKGKQLFDSVTGELIATGQQGVISGEIPVITGSNTGSITPTSLPTEKPTSSPTIIAGTDQTTGASGNNHPDGEDQCIVTCQSCSSGYCHDCNNNGICDENETDETGDLQTEETGGMSEEAQGTILYILKSNGPYSVITCTDPDDCLYCIDEDDDGLCSDSDCYLIDCTNKSECSYCLDCNRDKICDKEKIIITNCTSDTPCESFDYCNDSDMDGKCDNNGPESVPVINASNIKVKSPLVTGEL